jgi:RNA polymerase sigma-70 factor (ECF subfamily)
MAETNMDHPADDPLAPGLAAGDLRAWEALYDRLAGRLYRVAVRVLNCREDAEDAVQEAFTTVVRSRQRLAQVGELDAYLFAALRHAAARLAVQRVRLPAASDAAMREAVARSEHPREGGRSHELCQALGALPAEQREVIALKIHGELTFAQIGLVMGTSANTAASRYRYALEKLREAMRPEGCQRSDLDD